MTFPSTNPALDRALVARAYATPTAVQLAVLDPDAAGRDLLVSAQTGSGKTVAFGLAMAATLLGASESFERAAEPLALIIAPTRELAMQVQRELAWLYAETGARIVTCVGGMDPRAERQELSAGAHIVVGTPGRLRDHIERRRLELGKLKAIVLDEADEMLDLGFREDLEFILDKTPAERQTMLFSATLPRDIELLAKRFQRDAIRIQSGQRDEQHADIEYRALRVAPGDTENSVVNVLRYYEPRAALVFCATREAVKRMHGRLAERGFAAVALSGELTQEERTQALVAVRDGRARVLVATDVAARGLDLPDLALVIHAELPNDKETLLHRSGRTGRAGRKGMCVLIVPHNRRRKADALLGAARLQVTWAAPPTAAEIRALDQERFLADPVFAETATEAEQALVQTLQANRSAEAIALALVRLNGARLPEPEFLATDRGAPRRDERPREARPHWKDKADRQDGGGRDFPRGPVSRPLDDSPDMVWFRLSFGRDRNGDPKWILPLICKAGGVSKAEIGAIKIFDRETKFQIATAHAEQFEEAVRTNKNKEGHIARVGTQTSADDTTVTAAIDSLASVPADKPAAPRVHDQAEAPSSPPPREGANTERPEGANVERREGAKPARREGGKSSWREGGKSSWRESAKPERREGAKWTPRDGAKPAPREGAKAEWRAGAKTAAREGEKPAWRSEGARPKWREGATGTAPRGEKPAWRREDTKATPRDGAKPAWREGAKSSRSDGAKTAWRDGARPKWSDAAKATSSEGGKPTWRAGGNEPRRAGGNQSSRAGGKGPGRATGKPSWRDHKKPGAATRSFDGKKADQADRPQSAERREAKGPDAKYLSKNKHRLPAVS